MHGRHAINLRYTLYRLSIYYAFEECLVAMLFCVVSAGSIVITTMHYYVVSAGSILITTMLSVLQWLNSYHYYVVSAGATVITTTLLVLVQ
jgi:hypothetical protein